MDLYLTAKDAADQLGISASTLKRFCDHQGIMLSRTPGGHRRIDRSQLSLVKKLMNGKKDCPSPSSLDTEHIASLLIAADAATLQELIWSASDYGQRLVQVLEDKLVAAMWRIGDRWFKGEISVAEEKVCTATAALAIDNLCLRCMVHEEAPVYVGATFPPNRDTIASKIVQLTLRTLGVNAVDLGPGIEPIVLAEAAKQFRAVAVWISHTHIDDPAQLIEQHNALASMLRPGCRTIVGGGGLSPSVRRLIPHAEYYESMECLMNAEAVLAKSRSLPAERIEQIPVSESLNQLQGVC